jgi:heme-degrading monooxygenase HmoA
MSTRIVTIVDANVAADREQGLLDGFRQMNEGSKPPGLLRSELLRGQNGEWRIQTVWRDMDALMAVRNSGEPPAALALLDSLGAEHSHALFTLEQSHDA